MAVRFLHAADIHLGYRQYGSRVRYNDFAETFDAIVSDAIARRVDFVLLAGDLFHKRTVDPQTLLQATMILRRLQAARIPVLAVQGNHERPYQHEATSWLDYLAELDLLTLLGVRYRDGRIAIEPWDEERKTGLYVDLPGDVRVMGMQYLGASTSRAVRDLCDALADRPLKRAGYTILMLHAGLQGVLDGYAAALGRSQLEPLRPYVDYLALGHIHKPFSQDDWIYNPGSPETTSMAEVEWKDRGYLIAEADIGRPARHTVTAVRSPRRPFLRYPFQVDTYTDPTALYHALARFVESVSDDALRARQPVVELDLQGVLAFSRTDLDIGHIEALVTKAFDATVSRIKDSTVPSDYDIAPTEDLTRAQLERHILGELVERDARYRGQGAVWSELALRLKDMALTGHSPDEILAELGEYAGLLSEHAEREAVDLPEETDPHAEDEAPC